MQPIHFAIIGCGRIGIRHAQHIHTQGRLMAVCDTVESKARQMADIYQVPCFFSLDDMLRAALPVDVLVICTPNGLHAMQSIAALGAGYHVLVEKPMALSSSDANAMITAAQQAGKHLFVVQQNRFNPPVVAVKKALDENGLGIIYDMQVNCFWNRDAAYYNDDWRGTKTLDGGTLFTQFSHFIDIILWMFGDVKSVIAKTKNAAHQGSIEFEDGGMVMLEFENGIFGTMHYSVNSYRKNMEGSVTILGEKGSVKIGGEYLNTIDYECLDGYALTVPASDRAANDYGTYKGSMSNHAEVYHSLIQTLQHGTRYYTSAEDARKTIILIERIYHSAAHQKE